jgi:hypothetical protein
MTMLQVEGHPERLGAQPGYDDTLYLALLADDIAADAQLVFVEQTGASCGMRVVVG